MSPMSAPAANTLDPPVRTTAFTWSSASSSTSASLTSRTRSGLRALRTFGRLSAIVAIGGSTSTRMCSYPTGAIIDQMGTSPLRDSYGRVADDLRLSITDRCCSGVPAGGPNGLKREDTLRFEEIVRRARIFGERYGGRTIRIPGGEPL